MRNRVLVDSGPLVALFDKDDQFHQPSLDFIRHFRGVAVSSLAVITEVMYLLDFNLQAQGDFLRWVRDGALMLPSLEVGDFARIVQLTEKYADLPMDFADASLVVLAERLEIRKVASIDRDFSIYRYRDKLPFQNVFHRDS